MRIYNRKLQEYEESTQYGGGLLEILYNHSMGRILLKFVIHPVFSRVYGMYNDCFLSKSRIQPFAEKYQIPMEDYEKQEYRNFNDFFTRKIKSEKRPVEQDASVLVSPADSKLSVNPICKDNHVRIKGVEYTLEELVGNRVDLHGYQGGKCLVFRLSMEDYHRYIFVDNGRVSKRYALKGKLHTVSSISKEHKIYRENHRVVNVLETENFGRVIAIEVGALLVGKIVNHPIRRFKKGMEKGYFKLGGSTIVLLLKKDAVTLDKDILEKCSLGTEVKLVMGEKIGSKQQC